MMKKFNYIFFTVLVLFVIGCEFKIDTTPKEVKWDREVCERCKMIISDRKYAVQIINPKNGDRFYFDDIGCTILWFEEQNIDWKNDAYIYVTDAKTGKWIDARNAYWTYGAITPMAFGFSANKTKILNKENNDLNYVIKKVLETRDE